VLGVVRGPRCYARRENPGEYPGVKPCKLCDQQAAPCIQEQAIRRCSNWVAHRGLPVPPLSLASLSTSWQVELDSSKREMQPVELATRAGHTTPGSAHALQGVGLVLLRAAWHPCASDQRVHHLAVVAHRGVVQRFEPVPVGQPRVGAWRDAARQRRAGQRKSSKQRGTCTRPEWEYSVAGYLMAYGLLQRVA
jgi:hypothetical protein